MGMLALRGVGFRLTSPLSLSFVFALVPQGPSPMLGPLSANPRKPESTPFPPFTSPHENRPRRLRPSAKLPLSIKLSDQIEQLDELIHAEGNGEPRSAGTFAKHAHTDGMPQIQLPIFPASSTAITSDLASDILSRHQSTPQIHPTEVISFPPGSGCLSLERLCSSKNSPIPC